MVVHLFHKQLLEQQVIHLQQLPHKEIQVEHLAQHQKVMQVVAVEFVVQEETDHLMDQVPVVELVAQV